MDYFKNEMDALNAIETQLDLHTSNTIQLSNMKKQIINKIYLKLEKMPCFHCGKPSTYIIDNVNTCCCDHCSMD